MPARILSDIWSRGRSRLVIGSCLFNEFEGFPFGVGAEFRVPLRRTGVFMAHKRAYGVQRDVFACQPRAERVAQRVENDFVSSVGDAVIQAKDRYGLGEGIAQSALGYRFALVGKDKLGRLLRGDAFQHGFDRVVHVGDALAHLAVNVDEAVRKVQILSAELEDFPQTHTRVCGEQGNPVYAAGQVLEQIEQPVEFLRREEALPFVLGRKELEPRDRAGVESPVDHPFHHVHNIDQNQVDRGGSKGLPQGDCPAVPRPVDRLGYHEVSLEGLKLKGGDFTQQHVSERRADVRVVMIDARGTVFQGGETFFLENFPCLLISQILSPGFGKEFGMAFLTDAFAPDFACQYGCIAFATPAHLFPYQLPIKPAAKYI